MSESERRRKYRYDRVLIETARVLSSTLADAVVFLSGAQLEMLRNVAQYLRRLETYVTAYNPGYYLTPTVADYDDILAIVADLEEVLMGNPNTIWGYLDTYKEVSADLVLPAGESNVWSTAVPSGQVWRIARATWMVDSATCTQATVYAYLDAVSIPLSSIPTPTTQQLYPVACDVVLKEGHRMYLKVFGMTLNDDATLYLWGHKMAVPT